MPSLASPNEIDDAVANSPELLGHECNCCGRILSFSYYKRDSSYRSGYREVCSECEAAPRLSTEEHYHRVKGLNYNSEAVKKQRFANQEDFMDVAARIGKPMHASEFIRRAKKLVPNLYFCDGNIVGDIAVFKTYPQPQPHLEGRSFEYLWYIPNRIMPEYSIFRFDERDVPVQELERGWRTPTLRLIKAGLLSVEAADKEFGKAEGQASTHWYRSLWKFRNKE